MLRLRQRQRHLLLAVLSYALLISFGCGGKQAKPYVPHPGSVDEVDSKMYDALLVWNGALTQAKTEFTNGNISGESARAIINKTGEAYNTMRSVRQLYRTAKQFGNLEEAETQLRHWRDMEENINTLVDQIIKLTIGGKS